MIFRQVHEICLFSTWSENERTLQDWKKGVQQFFQQKYLQYFAPKLAAFLGESMLSNCTMDFEKIIWIMILWSMEGIFEWMNLEARVSP